MNYCGIYRIVNLTTNGTYLGSSVRIAKRMKDHRWALEKGAHINRYLQSAWNKYGATMFVFEPLVSCNEKDLEQREQEFIDAYIEHDMPLYNLKPSADPRTLFRYRATEESKAKQSAALKGKKTGPLSPETKRRLSIALRGRVLSLAHIENMRRSRLASGYIHSTETRAKISAAAKGRQTRLGAFLSEETKIKIGNANRNPSKETRIKLSVAARGRQTFLGQKHTLAAKAKISASSKGNTRWLGRTHSEETKSKLRSVAKLREQKLKLEGLGLIQPATT